MSFEELPSTFATLSSYSGVTNIYNIHCEYKYINEFFICEICENSKHVVGQAHLRA